MSIRSVARGLLERVTGSRWAQRVGQSRLRGRVLVLSFHDIVAPRTQPGGDHSLHLPFDSFRRFLDRIPPDYRVLPLPEITRLHRSSPPGLGITFDDAYAGALHLGLPELVSRRLPATVFVAPGLLGGPPPWWDAYADPVAGLPQDIRGRWLDLAGGEESRIDADASRIGRLRRSVSPDMRIAREEELTAASRLPGIALGAHSWSHPNLTRLDPARLAEEVARPRAWLRERFGTQFVPWFAYPYGLWNDNVAGVVRREGYAGAVAIGGGWPAHAAAPAFAWPRLNVPAGLTPDGFSARLAGFIRPSE